LPLFQALTLTISGLSAVVGLAALVGVVREYRLQGRQRRANQFLRLRERLKGDERFAEVSEWIDSSFEEGPHADQARRWLRHTPLRVKRDYLGLFEEVAISLNSGLIQPGVAYYMFGYYAARCLQSEEFWSNVNTISRGWDAFYAFAREAEHREKEQLEQDLEYDPRGIRF
jgi:hypothetical protein